MACVIPPVDMRFSRIYAKRNGGMDFVYFQGSRPASGPVVSPVAGTVLDARQWQRGGYRNAIIIRSSRDGAVVLSGLDNHRISPGTTVRVGDVLGQIEPISTTFTTVMIEAMRRGDVTSGIDPIHPYLHFEVWRDLPAWREELTLRGRRYAPETRLGILDPTVWWQNQGYVISGPTRSWTLNAVQGGPSDPTLCGGVT